LHDTVEDTNTTEDELRRLFGNEVTGNCVFYWSPRINFD